MKTPYNDSTFKAKITLLDKFIREASGIVVIGHFNPDGDSVGSLTAMYRYLSARNKRCTRVLPSPYPDYLHYLDPDSGILIYSGRDASSGTGIRPEAVAEAIGGADLIICTDFNSPARTEGVEPLLRATGCPRILIDHHPGPEPFFFDLAFSDPGMSSACELLFWILMEMPDIGGDMEKMDIGTATALATGMITDTNNFCNSTIPSTFTMSSLLLGRGVSLEEIHSRVFCCYSGQRMKLMGEMLTGMHVDSETHSAYMVLTRRQQMKFGFRSGDSEGFVNLGLKISDVDVSALFTEEKDRIRVSIRSKGRISANRLSSRFFNGGGHEKASGGRLDIPVGEVGDYFISSLKTFINDEGITFESTER